MIFTLGQKSISFIYTRLNKCTPILKKNNFLTFTHHFSSQTVSSANHTVHYAGVYHRIGIWRSTLSLN